uniref:Ig-like domain-containing protein n=1 Tax=Leptobrachium leishanense TaxID=445787 RepID=A0A8C5MBE8_9ANUR
SSTHSSVTFGCLVSKYFPEPVTIAMGTTTGQTSSTVTIFPAVQLTDPNISYSRSSQLTVSSSDWSKNTYQCLVNHNSINFQKIIPKGKMYLFPGSCPGENNLKHVQLVCQMYNFTSQTIEVTWYINGIETSIENKITSLGMSNGQFSFLCKVNVSQAQWNSGAYYKCQAKDTKTGKKVEDTIRKCSGMRSIYKSTYFGLSCILGIKFSTDLLVNKIAPLTCLASNLPSSTGYKFTWLQEGGGNLPFTTEDPTLNENGTYSVASVLITCLCPFFRTNSNFCYTEDNMSPPIVALFPPTSEEESSKEYVTYTCMASNFYPIDIYIGWSQDNQEIHKSLYVNSDPTWEVENASYFIVSKLKVPYEDWKENKAVSCVVGHKALPLHFIQRTIDKTTGKPTKTFVNIYMSDSNLSCP